MGPAASLSCANRPASSCDICFRGLHDEIGSACCSTRVCRPGVHVMIPSGGLCGVIGDHTKSDDSRQWLIKSRPKDVHFLPAVASDTLRPETGIILYR